MWRVLESTTRSYGWRPAASIAGAICAGGALLHCSTPRASQCHEERIARFSTSPPPKNKVVLLVIDVQNGFVREGSTEPVVPKVAELVKRWLDVGGEVVATRFDNSDPDGPFRRIKGMSDENWAKGSLKYKLNKDVKAALLQGNRSQVWVLDKSIYSCFTEEMRALVKKKGWTHFAICGFATDFCVLKTTVDCFEMCIQPLILQDACMTHRGRVYHEMALIFLQEVVTRDVVSSVDSFLQIYGA